MIDLAEAEVLKVARIDLRQSPGAEIDVVNPRRRLSYQVKTRRIRKVLSPQCPRISLELTAQGRRI
jgi:hypothetical protein